MNIYLCPICVGTKVSIEKIAAMSEKAAEDKLYNRLFDRFEWLEGDNLAEITKELADEGVYLGTLYDLEDF